ncbi:hypothetical protein [Acinetobacter pragensis]
MPLKQLKNAEIHMAAPNSLKLGGKLFLILIMLEAVKLAQS